MELIFKYLWYSDAVESYVVDYPWHFGGSNDEYAVNTSTSYIQFLAISLE